MTPGTPLVEDTDKFMGKKWTYFRYETYNDDAVALLFGNVDHFEFLLTAGHWRAKRRLMDLLAGLLDGGS